MAAVRIKPFLTCTYALKPIIAPMSATISRRTNHDPPIALVCSIMINLVLSTKCDYRSYCAMEGKGLARQTIKEGLSRRPFLIAPGQSRARLGGQCMRCTCRLTTVPGDAFQAEGVRASPRRQGVLGGDQRRRRQEGRS